MLKILTKLFNDLLILTVFIVIVCLLFLITFTSNNSYNNDDHIFPVKCSEYKIENIDDKIMKTTVKSNNTMNKLKALINCNTMNNFQPENEMKNDHYIIYNVVKANKKFECFDAITYTTHADYTFLDNLPVLIELWQNPISIALYAPGSDFDKTIDSIRYLRDCVPYVADFVTFHVYFPVKHIPSNFKKKLSVLPTKYDCKKVVPYLNVLQSDMYKSKNKLQYPINIGRNVARLTANTHYILPSDIELYPSLNLPKKFLSMIAEEPALYKQKRVVFTLAIFEVDESQKVPKNKTVLQAMLKNKTAIKFHQNVCANCHNFPKSNDWVQKTESNIDRFHIFTSSKRKGLFYRWEPIYISTNEVPLYDERLSWEGRNDKMTQAYIMCLLDYDFKVLDNAFLVHRPGIKTVKSAHIDFKLVNLTNKRIIGEIIPQIQKLYNSTLNTLFDKWTYATQVIISFLYYQMGDKMKMVKFIITIGEAYKSSNYQNLYFINGFEGKNETIVLNSGITVDKR